MHKFLACACKSQDFAQSQKSFRNSGKKTSFLSTESIKLYGANNVATQIEEGTHATMLVTKNGKRILQIQHI